jgi:hypothetical protein
MGRGLDKKEAMRFFIKRNSGIFRQDPFPWQVFKKLKHNFFTLQAKSPVPKDSEIAGEILEGMITNSQISKEDELATFLGLPFFNEKIQNKQYYSEKLGLKLRQGAPLLDIESLKKAEVAEKIRNEMREQIKKEVIAEKLSEIQEMDLKILEKNEEYRSLPSILDGQDYPLPDDMESEKSIEERFVPWWEKLGLKEDPFRELEGLSRIDSSLYNRIIYKTEIFVKYESMVENSFSELFRNTVVYGEWGSGKTTFFDYMSPILANRKILPIYTQLGGEFEVRELIFEFLKQVNIELKRLHNIFSEDNISLIGTLDDEQTIADLMKKLSYRGAKGFVIFVDDLHKGDLDKAMRFLSYLQVLSSKFRRATNLNIGFFVAGSLDWEPKIKSSAKFSGSISRQEHIPALKIEIALVAINRRLKAFAKNPENPRQIDLLFLERIYKALQLNSQEITFRRVMGEVLSEFESGHFDALSVDPIKISPSVLKNIRLMLEGNVAAKRRLDGIIFSSTLSPLQKRRSLELLVQAYLYNGLPESEIREPDVPFLQQLKHCGLIVKISENDLLSWKITRDLYEENKKVIKEYGLSLEDYLLRIYSDQLPEIIGRKKPPREEIVQIESLLTFLNRDLGHRFLNDARSLHLKILESWEEYLNLEENASVVIEKCTASLAKLTLAYMYYGKMHRPRRKYSEIILFWKDFWWSPEAILQFGRAASSDIDNRQKIPLVLALYREAFPQIVSFFKDEYDNAKLFYIPLSGLKNEEIKLLHECRHLWFGYKYKEVKDMLAYAIERKLKLLMYNAFTILYGDYENRIKFLDKESQASVFNSITRGVDSSYTITRNEFQYLNVSHFKNLMTGIEGCPEGRHNWKCIFSSVFVNWRERDLYNYLAKLDEFSKNFVTTSNDQETENGDYVLDFMKNSISFLRSVNQFYSKIITDNYAKQEGEEVCFSLCSFSYDDFQVPIVVSKEDIQRIKDVFSVKNRIRVRIDDQEYVEGFFGLNYRKAYAALAILHRGIDDKAHNAKYKLQILSSKGTEIRIALYKTTWASTPEQNTDETKVTSQPDSERISQKGNKITKSDKYDVFICYAYEDKEPFVQHLARELSKNLDVWYDDFSLSLGDSLRRKIDQGIAVSRYGIVVLSENFFKKDWPQKELDGLVAKERDFDKVILPIWHGVTRARVQSFSPILADRVAVSSDKGIACIVKEIMRVTRS